MEYKMKLNLNHILRAYKRKNTPNRFNYVVYIVKACKGDKKILQDYLLDRKVENLMKNDGFVLTPIRRRNLKMSINRIKLYTENYQNFWEELVQLIFNL